MAPVPQLAAPPPPPFDVPIQDEAQVMPDIWRRYFLRTITATYNAVNADTVAINKIPGVNAFLLAAQPSLIAGDIGFLGYVTDYGHLVRWTGTIWTLAPGDVENKFFRPFAGAPQEVGWQLCDGSVTDFLTVGGATLTATAFTTPNLTGTPAYFKTAAAYAGTINAASGSTATGTTGTGSTGTGTTGTGTSGNESSHTHAIAAQLGLLSSNDSIPFTPNTPGTGSVAVSTRPHTHTTDVPGQTSAAGSAHSHSVPGLSVPSLSVPGLSVPALGVGTIDPANLGVLMYYRR